MCGIEGFFQDHFHSPQTSKKIFWPRKFSGKNTRPSKVKKNRGPQIIKKCHDPPNTITLDSGKMS